MFRWLRQTKPPEKPLPTRLTFEGDAVHVFAAAAPIESFRWQDVTLIAASKQDCFGVDRIWLAFDVTTSPQPICIHEECEGWPQLIEHMEQRCTGFRADWWSAVAFPAFAENLTLIWKRPATGE